VHTGVHSYAVSPEPPKEEAAAAEEKSWSETETDVVHLDESSFGPFIEQTKSVLVMFYAPC
jgi:hypothetical protein